MTENTRCFRCRVNLDSCDSAFGAGNNKMCPDCASNLFAWCNAQFQQHGAQTPRRNARSFSLAASSAGDSAGIIIDGSSNVVVRGFDFHSSSVHAVLVRNSGDVTIEHSNAAAGKGSQPKHPYQVDSSGKATLKGNSATGYEGGYDVSADEIDAKYNNATRHKK